MAREEKPPFWLVWNPAGRVPLFRHEIYAEAIREAIRLAKANPHDEFYVLVPVSRCVKAEVRFDPFVSSVEAARLDGELAADVEAGVCGVEAED